jgi:hypothetical protein
MIDDLWMSLRSVIFMNVFIFDPPGGGKNTCSSSAIKIKSQLFGILRMVQSWAILLGFADNTKMAGK